MLVVRIGKTNILLSMILVNNINMVEITIICEPDKPDLKLPQQHYTACNLVTT